MAWPPGPCRTSRAELQRLVEPAVFDLPGVDERVPRHVANVEARFPALAGPAGLSHVTPGHRGLHRELEGHLKATFALDGDVLEEVAAVEFEVVVLHCFFPRQAAVFAFPDRPSAVRTCLFPREAGVPSR